ncbi:ABC transporter substrate-binding protein [Lacrimispora sp. JR3]|uniref:ABC transporter substrate-binding protein n=1 Tax=Lacrimispora sinapis TaxID=3111456 RepID=UPI003749F762
MKGKKIVYGAIIFILASLLAGCNHKQTKLAPSREGYQFTDALGQEITVQEPKRVVALMGSFAEIWLDAGGKLTAVTDDAYEERGLTLPKDTVTVGTYNRPNVEQIIACDPDLVLLSSETKEHVALKDTLKQAGITAAYFQVTYFEDYLKMLKLCTDITGRGDLYEKNGLAVKEQIDTIITKTKGQKSPAVLFLITYSGGALVKNSQCMTGKMLKDLGCENIADQNQSLLKEFNIESIMKADPDYIFVVAMGNDEELAKKNLKEAVENNPAWNGLSAVKNGRYIVLPKEKFLYKPDAKWGDSYAYLFEILYGNKP